MGIKEQQPGNQFSEQFRWFRRHIIVDHFTKSILIQVMWDQGGQLLYPEFQALKNGDYAQFLPQGMSKGDIEVRTNLRNLIGSGYTVKPVFFQGIENEEHAVLMLTDITEPKLTQQVINN